MGKGLLMVARGVDRARTALAGPPDPEITLERLSGLEGRVADAAADAMVAVLLTPSASRATARSG